MIEWRPIPSVRPYLFTFRINRCIARICSYLVLYRVLAVVLSFWRRDHNHMDSYQVISVAFYSGRENSDKFSSEALISAWGSFTCCKSKTRNPLPYFPSKGKDFYSLKEPSTPAGIEPANLESSGEYDNHGTTGVDDSYRVNTVDVPESPIPSGARDLWQQQRCESMHCHE